MIILYSILLSFIFYISSFIVFLNTNILDKYENIFPFYDKINFLPNIILFTISIIILFFSIYVYYILLKKNSPRWRVYKANKLIVFFRKNNFNFGNGIAYLRKIDPFVFEEMLLSLFYEKGFKIKRNKRYTGDGGLDGIVYLNGQKYLIQAKRYSNYINKKHVLEFNDLCKKHKAKGFFIHTGKTGAKSKQESSDYVDFISGENLFNFILGKDVYLFNKKYSKNKKIKNK